MNEKEILVWKEKLKEDLYFSVNLRLYMINYRSETNGISVRKGDFTETFKQWVSKHDIGPILLEEVERRKIKKEGI